MSIRENFLRLRAQSGLTQEDVARRLDVSRQSVAKWEAGKSTPDLDKLIALADLFDVSLDELVRGRVGATAGADGLASSHGLQGSQGSHGDESASDSQGEDATELADGFVAAAPMDSDAAFPESSGDSQGEDAHQPTTALYLAHMTAFARRIGAGVGLIILGFAVSVLFDVLGNFPSVGIPRLHADAWAGIFSLAGVAVGLWLIIPAGIGHAAFRRRHSVLDLEFSERELDEASHILVTHLVWGLTLILLGVIVLIALSPNGRNWEEIGAAILLVLAAVGVEELIYGGIRGSAIEGHEREADAAEAVSDCGHSLPGKLDPVAAVRSRRNRIVGAVCGIIMLIATIVGLGLFFIGGVWLFWLAWPIGGLTCGIVSLAGDALLAVRVDRC